MPPQVFLLSKIYFSLARVMMPCIITPNIFRWGTARLVWLLKPGMDFVWRNPHVDVLTSGCPRKLQGVRVRATCRDAV